MAEAFWMSNPSGIGQALRAGTLRSSACEPKAFTVTTFWPTLRCVTSAPTSTISPAA